MTTATTAHPRDWLLARPTPVARHRHWRWLAVGVVLFFLIPFALTDLVSINRDLYYGIYISAVFAFFGAWICTATDSPRAVLTRNWRAGVGLGALVAGVMVAIVLNEPATNHPHGIAFAAAILWRGILYGFADGLILSAFPILAVFAAFAGTQTLTRWRGKAAVAALALAASMLFTAVYHLGYSDFRSDKVRKPLVGDVIWSLPTLATLSPFGAPIAHAGLHVSAVVHSYETDIFLPPHATATPTIALRPCTIGGLSAQCGTLRVAENQSEPNGKTIPLKVAVFKATSDKPVGDPLFWFAGWGSAGVSDDAANVVSAFTALNWNRDVVFIDQRGTGSSELVCRWPVAQQATAATLRRITAAARRCAERIGPNLRYYTSAVAVDDFDQVRQALGYDRINIYGGSYGVTTGQIYLLRHGSHVRSAVFDSGSLLDVHIFEQQPLNKQRVLEQLFARCTADTACNAAYPNLRGEYAQLLTRLARHPIPIPGTELMLDAAAFVDVLDGVVAYTPGKAAAPRLIHLVATGQVARAAAELPPAALPTTQLAYQLLIQCNEPWASWRPTEIARNSAGTDVAPLYRTIAATVGASCAGFPRVEVPAAIGERVRSEVPVLFLSGAEDGADPPANIANARRELPNSRSVVFPAAGHGQLGFRCTQNLIAEFIARGATTGLDASCAQTAALQPFDTRP
jgi:pimeloyl-ACP methyl ester carboxylesterase